MNVFVEKRCMQQSVSDKKEEIFKEMQEEQIFDQLPYRRNVFHLQIEVEL